MKSTDARVDQYPLTSSPMAITILVALYVYFVTNWGQRYMKSRPAYDLNTTIKVYNLIQIVVNLFIGFYVSIAFSAQFPLRIQNELLLALTRNGNDIVLFFLFNNILWIQ